MNIAHPFLLKIYRNEWFALFFIAILTALASEVKVIPFYGGAFRFGLGSMTFFLLILIRPPASIIRTGLITGVSVVGFRLLVDLITDIPVWTSLENHLPAFLFYTLFSLGFSLIQLENYKSNPLLLGVLATGFEVIGNGAEQLIRYWLVHHQHIGLYGWLLLIGVAVFRSFFIVGLYSAITLSVHKKQMQEMLNIGAELYAESLYLQKSMDHIEQITASSYSLYRQLKQGHAPNLSLQALQIAQEIHEVKKDSQRILSGLAKITVQRRNEVFCLSDVFDFVMTANKNYSELLKKNITFQSRIHDDFETNQQIPLLALLNNLTANAIEAIEEKGTIDLTVTEESHWTIFEIKDTGKGIPEEEQSLIFEPGYTTKYNDQGTASTGIGLSHVQAIVQSLGGSIQVTSLEKGTAFRVTIPTASIRKEDV